MTLAPQALTPQTYAPQQDGALRRGATTRGDDGGFGALLTQVQTDADAPTDATTDPTSDRPTNSATPRFAQAPSTVDVLAQNALPPTSDANADAGADVVSIADRRDTQAPTSAQTQAAVAPNEASDQRAANAARHSNFAALNFSAATFATSAAPSSPTDSATPSAATARASGDDAKDGADKSTQTRDDASAAQSAAAAAAALVAGLNAPAQRDAAPAAPAAQTTATPRATSRTPSPAGGPPQNWSVAAAGAFAISGGGQLLRTLSLTQLGGATASNAKPSASIADAEPSASVTDATTVTTATDAGAFGAATTPAALGAAILPQERDRSAALLPNDPNAPKDFSLGRMDAPSGDFPLAEAAAPNASLDAAQAAPLPQAALDGAAQALSVASFETHFPAAIAQMLPSHAAAAAPDGDMAQTAAATAERLAALAAKPQQQAIKTVNFQLAPEAYGAINVKMRILNSRVELQLDASTPQAQALLRESRDKIAEAIGVNGYSVDVMRIGVSAGPASSDTPSTAQGGGSQSFAAESNQSESGNFAGRDRASGGRSESERIGRTETQTRGDAASSDRGGRSSGLYL
jgi:hypothetical protein